MNRPETLPTSPYLFAFNGKEKDSEVKGEGKQLDFGERIYDPRLAKFLSIDPLFKMYPSYSPFQYVFNSPLWTIDLDGLGDPLTVMKIRKNRASNLQGMVRNGGTRPHQGFDLAAAPGTTVYAVKNSVVHSVRSTESYGKQIVLKITNSDGTYSYAFYAHLSCIGVSEGDIVSEGQEIGETGQTGNASGQSIDEAHLHFEYRSIPLPGTGLGGRLSPNDILDTKFYSQDVFKDQTNTGIIVKYKTGDISKMNLNGNEMPIYTPSPEIPKNPKNMPVLQSNEQTTG